MPAIDQLIGQFREKIGARPNVGEWLELDQKRIDDFARVTGDFQWIHTDVARAKQESPFGVTVAHGFLVLSLLPFLTGFNHPDFFLREYPGMRFGVNYGLDRLRFPAPVPASSRIRATSEVIAAERVGDAAQLTYRFVVEIEGSIKPACVADMLVRVYQ